MGKDRSPLPLTAFEEYMFRDDRPACPMSMVARLRFGGALDREAASAAWGETIARHPLLRARVRANGKRRPEWVEEDRTPALCWTTDAAHDVMPQMARIDLTKGPGARAWASTDLRQSTLVLHVHHAACDGKGVLQVCDDFLRGYARAIEGASSEIPLSPRDATLLPRRGTFGLTAGKLLKMLPAQLTGLVAAGQFLLRQPVALLAGQDTARLAVQDNGHFAERDEYDCPCVRTDRIDSDLLRRLSAAAEEQQVTVNDWLLRDFFVAVDEFRRRHDSPREIDWVRVTVPINLRQTCDDRLPAANVVSMVFLDRNARQAAKPAELLRGIHEEIARVRRRQLGYTLHWSLALVRALPGGLSARRQRAV